MQPKITLQGAAAQVRTSSRTTIFTDGPAVGHLREGNPSAVPTCGSDIFSSVRAAPVPKIQAADPLRIEGSGHRQCRYPHGPLDPQPPLPRSLTRADRAILSSTCDLVAPLSATDQAAERGAVS